MAAMFSATPALPGILVCPCLPQVGKTWVWELFRKEANNRFDFFPEGGFMKMVQRFSWKKVNLLRGHCGALGLGGIVTRLDFCREFSSDYHSLDPLVRKNLISGHPYPGPMRFIVPLMPGMTCLLTLMFSREPSGSCFL